MDVDVLLWGGTMKFEAYELEGKFFVNPGSATGAMGMGWVGEGEEVVPSFCLMDVSRRGVSGPHGRAFRKESKRSLIRDSRCKVTS